MKKKILITAALPYVNNVPHLGHIVGCHLPADVFYKFHILQGNDAVFVGGSDDHGTATLISAKELGYTPKELVNKFDNIHRAIYKKLGISYSLNSGTSTPTHEKVTVDFFNELEKNGYISEQDSEMLFCEHDKIALADRFVVGVCPKCGAEGAYGDQCDACGETYETKDLINPKCKFCGSDAVRKGTKHLYLRLDKLEKQLDAWLESKKDVFRPHVYKEAKRWINEGLKPRAITRDISWGITVPKKGYEDKVFYVWFDAPIGYISITKELGGDELVKKYWQDGDAEIYNFIGKDNIPFHTVFFPAMQLGNKNYNLAHNVVGFAFMNYEGQKFSKSKGVGVFCDGILDSDIDIDTLRAYLVTVFPENKDSDFKWEDYKNNTNSELVGKYGNFFNRTLNMIWKNFEGKLNFEITPNTVLNEEDNIVIDAIKTYPNKIKELLEKTEFREAYKTIMELARVGNTYLERTAPWTLLKNDNVEEVRKILYICLNLAKTLCVVASPILMNKTQEIWTEQLGFSGNILESGNWELAGKLDIPASHTTLAPKPLFARIDDERLNALKEHFSKTFDMSELKNWWCMEIEQLFKNSISQNDINQLSPLALAFVGDSIHTMFVRDYLVKSNILKLGDYHKKSSHYCCAKHQSNVLDLIEQDLSDGEKDIIKRARNAKTNNVAKNSSLQDYKKATSFEALVGFLYLSGNYDRLKQILSISVK